MRAYLARVVFQEISQVSVERLLCRKQKAVNRFATGWRNGSWRFGAPGRRGKGKSSRIRLRAQARKRYPSYSVRDGGVGGGGACGGGSREAVPESGVARAPRLRAVSRGSSASRDDSRVGLVAIAIPSRRARRVRFPPVFGNGFAPRGLASQSRSEGSASLRDRRRAVGRPRRGPRGNAAYALGRARVAGADAARWRCGPDSRPCSDGLLRTPPRSGRSLAASPLGIA